MNKPEDKSFANLLVLIVEDEGIMRLSLEDRLELEGIPVISVADVKSAVTRLRRGDVDVVVTDIRLPDGTGEELFHKIAHSYPGMPVIFMTAFGSVPHAVELVKSGATDYLIKPFDMDTFISRVKRSLSRALDARLAGEIKGLDGFSFKAGSGMLGKSPQMLRIERLIQRVHNVDSSVLITGESGVGKEVVATLVHQNSHRADAPFIKVNCAAIPSTLVESELFGHEKGAFVGADKGQIGYFEQADGGTIFLDEITEIPPGTQVKLLRVVQERTLERLGRRIPIDLDVRIVAATQVNLEEAVENGTFRSDLYWRLNVIRIHIPPLRERDEDILYLARLFVNRQAEDMGKNIIGLSPGVEAYLLRQNYPGNVRELRNIVERALAICDATRLEMHDLLPFEAETLADQERSLKESVIDAEKRAIKESLVRHGGVIGKAAGALGVSRKSLWEKMKRYEINKP